jgi:hypothetical protein
LQEGVPYGCLLPGIARLHCQMSSLPPARSAADRIRRPLNPRSPAR